MSDIIAYKDSNNNYWDTEVEIALPLNLNLMMH